MSTIDSDTIVQDSNSKVTTSRSVSHDVLKLVYNILRENSANGRCRITVTELGQLAGVSRGTAHRALRSLAAQGFVTIEPARHITEPNTVIINDRGMAGIALQVQDKIDEIEHGLKDLALLVSQIKPVPDEKVRKEAVFYRQLLNGILSASVLYDNVGQLVVDLTRLDPELRAIFGRESEPSTES